ncbi:UDP-N-acetylmuramoyl-tripeptide--D-alanyl-D-alanine ligase [Peptococcaceae bacterium 1198_IL3148]
MKKLTVKEIITAINGRLLQGNTELEINNVCTDSRKLNPGDLFFALKGENFDGHHYVQQAVNSGAAALVVDRELPDLPKPVTAILVTDTLKALQQLAGYHRRRFDIPVVGVTGSNGKTTTKDLIAAVLGQRYRVLKNQGNFNNEIGLPLTLLALDDHNAAVVEMGMRGGGQIDALCNIADISAAVITNIGETHLELLGSVENIAAAKGEILDHVPLEGFALIPAASSLALAQAKRCRGKVYTFGVECSGDYVAADVVVTEKGSSFNAVTPQGTVPVELPIPGRHNVSNAMAALALGLNLGLTLTEVAAGLKNTTISAMRLEILQFGEITVINDAYNANPDSTKAGLKTLADLAGGRRQVAVLGSMFELGAREVRGHYETGAAAVGVDLLVTVGQLAKNIATGAKESGMAAEKVQWFADNQSATSFLKSSLQPGDIVLIKGSRGMHMEEIVAALQ